jgi:hypothetical protein
MIGRFYLAQIDGVFAPTGGEADALGAVQGSIDLSRRTVESWNTVWTTAIDPLDGRADLSMVEK